MSNESERAERGAVLLSTAILAGVKASERIVEAGLCMVKTDDPKLSSTVSYMASLASLISAEIAIIEAGGNVVSPELKNLSELRFVVRRATLASHVFAGAVTQEWASQHYPELHVDELSPETWKSEVNLDNLAKSFKAIATFLNTSCSKNKQE